MDHLAARIREIVREALSCSGHNMEHVERVHELCLTIAAGEGGADLNVLVPAALLHDIARAEEDADITGQLDHAELGAEQAARILAGLGCDEEQIRSVCHCILTHRYRNGHLPTTPEARILFDADKLDALGAVGVARSFMLAGQHNERLYAEEPLESYIRENITAEGRLKHPSRHTPNYEYELKFRHLPEKMYTETGRRLALERSAFMEEFFARLRREIAGSTGPRHGGAEVV